MHRYWRSEDPHTVSIRRCLPAINETSGSSFVERSSGGVGVGGERTARFAAILRFSFSGITLVHMEIRFIRVAFFFFKDQPADFKQIVNLEISKCLKREMK